MHSFSLSQGFVLLGFPCKVFNEAASNAYEIWTSKGECYEYN